MSIFYIDPDGNFRDPFSGRLIYPFGGRPKLDKKSPEPLSDEELERRNRQRENFRHGRPVI